jgi:hypothetical protein
VERVTARWESAGWYRIDHPDGSLWMETSVAEEALVEAARTGWPLRQLWSRTDTEWRDVPRPEIDEFVEATRDTPDQ